MGMVEYHNVTPFIEGFNYDVTVPLQIEDGL